MILYLPHKLLGDHSRDLHPWLPPSLMSEIPIARVVVRCRLVVNALIVVLFCCYLTTVLTRGRDLLLGVIVQQASQSSSQSSRPAGSKGSHRHHAVNQTDVPELEVEERPAAEPSEVSEFLFRFPTAVNHLF